MEYTRIKLIKEYMDFFKKKNHKEIPNSSLIPENDPTILFTTAGMHPIVPYLLGEKNPQGKRLVNVQRCIRTGDIDEVGDAFHHTFFEMLGNWSLGDYFKKDAINYSFEFLTKILKIQKEEISVTCFKGDNFAPKDTEAEKIWKSLGIKKIEFLGKENNWWGPAGKTGPCGPDTEMFVNNVEIWNDVFMQYNKTKSIILIDGMHCLYKDDFEINKNLLEIITSFDNKKILVVNGYSKKAKEMFDRYNIEIFSLEDEKIKKDNIKFFEKLMQKYNLSPKQLIYFDHDKENVNSAVKSGIKSILYKNDNEIKEFIEDNNYTYVELKQQNVDTGMGVERMLAILNGFNDNYLTEIWEPIIKEIEDISTKSYEKNKKTMRIIADHIKAAVFILADGIVPSNVEQGYVLRRLIRRAIRNIYKLGIVGDACIYHIARPIFEIYKDYSHLQKNKEKILNELKKEEERFLKTLESGEKLFEKLTKGKKQLAGKDAFLLYQSYGFPIELTEDMAKEKNIKIDIKEFEKEFSKHQELSRTSTEGKFKSGLADNSEATTKLHTTTHLLLAALRIILKNQNIIQKGSNITAERLRFDFSFPRKLTDKEIKDVEELVNAQIQNSCEVKREEMSVKEAKSKGAIGVFDEKYGEKVSVYSIGNFSKEICAGPHVKNICNIGKFKILKEESSASGVRRIKAILE